MSLRILIVEDEPLIALDIETAVAESGLTVAGMAHSVEEALSLVGSTDFDVAILDANLRGESASPVAARLKERRRPFVAVSGYSTGQLTWLDGAPLLGKPFSRRHLVEALNRVHAGRGCGEGEA